MISPNSSLLSSIFIPDYFIPRYINTLDSTLKYDSDYSFEIDNNGIRSIIKLNLTPFIDLSKYNFSRKSWYWIDSFDGIWEVVEPGYYNADTNEINNSSDIFVKSIEGYYNSEYISTNNIDSSLVPKKYNPINIKINNVTLNDITEYSNPSNIPVLNFINNDLIKEFYYDFNRTIYTNQNLDSFDSNSIEIGYYYNINSLRVRCIMSSNSTGLSSSTPVVDHYLLKLSGQNL